VGQHSCQKQMAMVNANPENKITIRLVKTIDWQTIRDVTLNMLADAPRAFGDTLVKAESREMKEWQHWAKQLSNNPYRCVYIAQDHQGICGFVIGDATFSQLPPGAVLAARLWVASHQRGMGLGRKLMDVVAGWAEEQGMDQVVAEIIDTNLNAVKFYEHLGYHVTGTRELVLDDSPRQLIVMARKLEQ
jgi:L-amino acid N-acyltransferase YncA